MPIGNILHFFYAIYCALFYGFGKYIICAYKPVGQNVKKSIQVYRKAERKKLETSQDSVQSFSNKLHHVQTLGHCFMQNKSNKQTSKTVSTAPVY